MKIRAFASALIAAFGCVTAQPVLAQAWPDRPVRIVNPYAAGGPSELVTRHLAEGLSAELGQRFIVESRPGGGTVIGANAVAKAPADGYTFLLTTVAPLIVQPAINPALPYDPVKDFVPVGLFATVPNLIAVHPSVAVNNIRELIAMAKAQPEKLNYASAGNGSGPHLAGELFSSMAGVKMTHVPFGGAAPAVLAVLGGQVQVSFVNITPQVQHVKAGKLRALAITSRQRSSLLPEVPTVAESGLPGYLAESWNGITAPAATPRAVIERLQAAMGKVMNTPKMRESYAPIGAEVSYLGAAEFAAYMKEDEKQIVPIIKAIGLKAN